MLWDDLWSRTGRQYSVFFLCQKLANLNTALGFGQNDQCGGATSKSWKDTSVCRNIHINFSEFVCRRVGVSASCPVIVRIWNWLIRHAGMCRINRVNSLIRLATVDKMSSLYTTCKLVIERQMTLIQTHRRCMHHFLPDDRHFFYQTQPPCR